MTGLLPGRNITSLLHEGTECKPKAVAQREVGRRSVDYVFVIVIVIVRHLSFVWTEPTDDCQRQTDAKIRHNDTHPNLRTEWRHKRKHARLLLLRFLYHDADAEVHERLGEVDDAFSL